MTEQTEIESDNYRQNEKVTNRTCIKKTEYS